MTTVTKMPRDGGFMNQCYVVARNYTEPPLFRADAENVRAYLDRYAVIPLEVFEAMGGTQHPAFQGFQERLSAEFNAQNDTT